MQKNLSIKLAVIGFVSLLLLIPLTMISGKITERSEFLFQAKQDVSQSWTGKQTVMTALVVFPYEVDQEVTLVDKITRKKTLHISRVARHKLLIPDSINIQAGISNDIRQKGIYKIPVYTGKLNISGIINPASWQNMIREIEKEAAGGSIGRPYLTTTVSDPRGINSIPSLSWQGKTLPFLPGSKLAENNQGLHAYLPDTGHKLGPINFDFQLELRGMQTLSFIPAGREAEVNASSSWPHPQFTGAFLPVVREISQNGYRASWKITSFASNIGDKVSQCESGACEALFTSDFGVKHIEAVDIYLQSERSVKYGMLFIGLSFISFFIFEIMMKLPIHPIQYSLVGFAIAIFYLLLISLSEHIPFVLAYLTASLACTALLLCYLRYVLAGFKQALVFSALLLLLYGILYIIISAEDLALVMGALLTFIALALIMFTTRHINWYQVGEQVNSRHNNRLSTGEESGGEAQ
ncbi:cell envelope integrity protein CreD [Thalassomonas viridans]|uniref:Cell envelope integrity protein CreD n=1 Tax=Thalassomonas viridans TaxID=137584 RepID=A0AAE9Z2Z3_9GAMM|nr:cell envelope integrity protein CreD [Thalassomonas viridans]WDE05105.1 cell envelope integrity protein CreD [Thalassomonas viridans]